MRKKLVFVLFIIAIASIVVIFLQNRYFQAPEKKITASRVVVPQVSNPGEELDEEHTILDPEMISKVPLNSDETLLYTVDMDFDGDSLNDQVNAIRVAGNPFISLIVGLFIPQKGEYERVATIATPIRQLSTFSYTGIDLTGDHRVAIVYQGFVDTGKAVLQAFFITKEESSVSVSQIANLEGDGTIYIDQTDRSDAYLISAANDPSYSIWVYSTDPDTGSESATKYDWDDGKQQYIISQQTTESMGATIPTANQRKNNTSGETYLSMLDGLWYKIDDGKESSHYLYVSKEDKHVLFLEKDQYELYEWIRSTPRSNGLYITAKNDEITNYQRQIDISFNGSNQFKLRVVDFLFLVSDGGSWNGEYKKMADATSYLKAMENREPKYVAFKEKLESTQWSTADGTVLTFEKGNYTAEGDELLDTGSYTALDSNGKSFIQFRSSTGSTMFRKTYLMTKQDKQKNNILLTPYVLTPDQSYAMDDHILILTPYVEEE